MGLSEFLAARLDEDYEVAYGGAPSPWVEGAGFGNYGTGAQVLDKGGDVTAVCYYGGTYGHVLTFDPTRVLAMIAAARTILGLHEPRKMRHRDRRTRKMRNTVDRNGVQFVHCEMCGDPDGWDQQPPVDWPCPTLLALVQPYSDHADFDPTWTDHRPDAGRDEGAGL